MSTMHASCVITIQPTITPDGLGRLAEAVIDRLWPGNQGGVVLVFRRRTISTLAPIAFECIKRQQAAEMRVVRNGVTITVEPVYQRDRS